MKDLKLSLIVEALDRATEPLRKVGHGIEAIERRAEALHKVFHKLGLAEFIGGSLFTGALAEGAHVLVETTDKIAEMAEGAKKASEALGINVEDMQRWSYAAKQVGVDAEALPRAFGMMEQHVSQAITGNKESIGALKQLGISLKEIRAISNDPSAMISRIMRGFEGIKNATQRTRIGRDFFGRGWLEVAPLLTAPREEIERFFERMKKSGAEMSKEDAETAHAYIDAKNDMGLAVQGLQKKVTLGLMPALTASFNKISEWLENLSPRAVDHFTHAVSELIDELPKLLPRIQGLIERAVDLANKLLTLSDNTNLVKGVLGTLVAFMTVQAVVAFTASALSIAKVGIAAVTAVPMIAGLIPMIGGLTDVMAALDLAMAANPIGLLAIAVAAVIAVVALLVLNWDKVVAVLKVVWVVLSNVGQAIWAVASRLVEGLGLLLKGIVWLVQGAVKLVVDGLKVLWNLIPAPLRALLEGTWNAGLKILMDATAPAAPASARNVHGSPHNPNAPYATHRVGNGRPMHQGAITPARADVHLHLDSRGQLAVSKISGDGGADVSVHRGLFVA